MIFKEKKTGRLTVAGSLLVLMAGFLFVLMGMNVYQYFKLKTHFAAEVISRKNKNEVEKLKAFFTQVSEKLLVVRDLGKNGALGFQDIVALNKKFFPLIENREQLSGVILADDRGREYFLTRQGSMWVTRMSSVSKGRTRMVFQQWKAPDQPVRKWEKYSDYDPMKRPWFHRSTGERQVYWSPVYKFFSTGRPGVTASISWKRTDPADGLVVFALDVPLDQVQQLLVPGDSREAAILFLVNPQDNFFITARQMGRLEKEVGGASSSNATNDSVLISSIFQEWSRIERPADHFVKVDFNRVKWLASMRPLSEENNVYWVGIAAPEKVLLSDLRKDLFQVDLPEVVIALIGGSLVLLVFWKFGGFRSGAEERTEAPIVRLNRYTTEGEGSRVEFKSTVRTNLKTGKHGKEIEFAWLKAVVAFLNSTGGALVIGVDDKGRVVGIDADGFENADKCQLHLKNLINHHIGAEYSSFIRISLVDVDGSTVVLIECSPAPEPVFLRIGKNEEFYIRSGPSSIKLSPSQMISYVLQNMKKRK